MKEKEHQKKKKEKHIPHSWIGRICMSILPEAFYGL
jgi:hypothetical protein